MRLNPFRRKFVNLPYADAMQLLRILAYNGSTNHKAMVALARRARDAAPTEQERRHAERFLVPLEAGRRIRTSTWPVKFYTGGETYALDRELEDALEGIDVPPGFRGDDER